jgi:hypothetical protein
MAKSSSIVPDRTSKSPVHPFLAENARIENGLVHHELISASDQVKILAIVDETGSSTIGDIIAELSGHPDPVGATMVMVCLGILVLKLRGPLDAHTIVRRADPDPTPESQNPVPTPAGGGEATSIAAADPHQTLQCLAGTPFSARVFTASGDDRREFARMDMLRRPGIYGLISSSSIYIGMGGDVGLRVATGQQPIEGVESLFVIVDDNDVLTIDDAKVAERILWSRAYAAREKQLINGVPDGAAVDAERYSNLEAFVAQACLTLRHHDVFFTHGSARAVLAGPRGEPGRVGPLRALDSMPRGEIVELNFADGLIALAARQSDQRWVLLQGSEVKPETARSANASTSYLRASWLHGGLLAAGPGGRCYVTTRDLVFGSGSAVAQFCTGSKGKSLAAWRPIDPEGGFDPATPLLIAS